MDARLDTLSDELCQVDTRVGRIARQQTRLGGYVESASPSLEDNHDDSDNDDDDEDEDASLSNDDKMVDLLTVCHS